MSGITITAPAGGWAPPWPVVVEVAAVLPAGSWVLVGGLMVQLHARAAGVDVVRPTDDVDALVDVMAEGVTVSSVADRLCGLGFVIFEPGWENSPAHRLQRGHEVIDLLVADHLPNRKIPRLAGRRPWPRTAARRPWRGQRPSRSSTATRLSICRSLTGWAPWF